MMVGLGACTTTAARGSVVGPGVAGDDVALDIGAVQFPIVAPFPKN